MVAGGIDLRNASAGNGVMLGAMRLTSPRVITIGAVAAAALVAATLLTSDSAPSDGHPPTTNRSFAPAEAWLGVTWTAVDDPFAAPAHPLLRVDGLVDAGRLVIGWGRIPRTGNQFGDAGAVFLSADGAEWVAVPLIDGVPATSTSEIQGIAVNDTGYLAYGGVCCDREARAMWHSSDGSTWRRLEIGGEADLGRIGFTKVLGVGHRWVAVGSAPDGTGSIWTSEDALAWDLVLEVERGVPGWTIADAVTTADGLYAAGTVTGDDGSYDGAVWQSSDGDVWERLAVNDQSLVGEGETRIDRVLAHAGGLLLSGVHASTEERQRCDQLGMADGAITPQLTTIDCGWGTDRLWQSADGATWSRIDLAGIVGEHPIEFRVMAAGGPGILVLGESSGPASPDTKLFASADGARWSVIGPDQPMHDGIALALLARGRDLLALTEQFDGQESTIDAWIGRAR